jgi:ATP-dependent DNA ligase
MKQTCAPRETLAIAGYALGGKKWDGLYLGRRKGDDLIYAGKVDYSFDSASAKDLQTRLKPLIRKTRPYAKKDSTSRHLGRTVAAGGSSTRRSLRRGKVVLSYALEERMAYLLNLMSALFGCRRPRLRTKNMRRRRLAGLVLLL